jgi:hypothetical protein
MCTEFFLVIIYFLIILTINYFFFKLLKTYLINIIQLTKFKNIFSFFKGSDLLIVSNLYLNLKLNSSNLSLLKRLNNLLEIHFPQKTEDLLLVGNFYKFLNKKYSVDSNKSDSNNFYFQLLNKQYLEEIKN